MAEGFNIPIAKFRILPNAVDPIVQTNTERREPFTVLTVSRMGAFDREKNIDQMIRAIAKLRTTLPDVKFVVIGDGVLRPEFEDLAKKLGVSDIVDFRGWVSAKELRVAYEQASVFAMPSSKEGFGIVYLEAWQHGIPVICSKHGASSEIVVDGGDGFIVDPEDCSMIADRLHTLLSRPELARLMGERGRDKVVAKYLDSTFQENLSVLLDKAAG
jgi:glycosyltransferase involved in cell wall biosynthesis